MDIDRPIQRGKQKREIRDYKKYEPLSMINYSWIYKSIEIGQ